MVFRKKKLRNWSLSSGGGGGGGSGGDDTEAVLHLVHDLDTNLLGDWDHRVSEIPTGPAGKLCHDDIAVPQEVDVEVDVADWLGIVSTLDIL